MIRKQIILRKEPAQDEKILFTWDTNYKLVFLRSLSVLQCSKTGNEKKISLYIKNQREKREEERFQIASIKIANKVEINREYPKETSIKRTDWNHPKDNEDDCFYNPVNKLNPVKQSVV